ncbi:MAG: zf-TFIIB domain-containing protein [archaeon]
MVLKKKSNEKGTDKRGKEFQMAPLNCPRCAGVRMRKLSHPTGAVLDICDRCGGMWLDREEVLTLFRKAGGKTSTAAKKDRKGKDTEG